MKASIITLIIVLAALITIGIFIFSGNNQQDQPDINTNQGTQAGADEAPETNQTEETETSSTIENQPQTYNIEIKGYSFNPSMLTIKTGDTVIWTNKDNTQHTVTSDSGKELNSQYLSNGNSYSKTFNSTGTFSYHCRPHPGMKGKIIVS